MYVDKEYPLKILQDGKDIGKVLDLGVLTAGQSRLYEFVLFNDGRAHLLNLAFKVDHKEVNIIKAPEMMEPFTKEKLLIEWKASITLREGLRINIFIDADSEYRS